MTRIIICGSRRWNDRERIANRLGTILDEFDCTFPEPTIVHGNAKGADRIAAAEAGKAGLVVEAHPADWQRYGKRAGLVRNEEMAALGADLCIAFWDGNSNGTAHMLAAADAHGIPTEIVLP